MPRLKRCAVYAGGSAVALSSVIAAKAAWNALDFQLEEHTVPVLEPGAQPIRLLHISDIHMAPGQSAKAMWLRSLADLEPDLVINTGDNLARHNGEGPLIEALAPLLERPGAFVPGSHCYHTSRLKNPLSYLNKKRLTGEKIRYARKDELDWRRMHAAFEDTGWVNAANANGWIKLPAANTSGVAGSEPRSGSGFRNAQEAASATRWVAVSGVDDPHIGLDQPTGWPEPTMEQTIGTVAFRLGLTHAPYRRVLNQLTMAGADLILAGHTHGGQLALPGFGAVVSNADIPAGRAAGLGVWIAGRKRTYLNVSQGIGASRFVPFRTGFKPAASLITLVAREV